MNLVRIVKYCRKNNVWLHDYEDYLNQMETLQMDMKTLGVYKAEFEPMIRAYGQLREQNDALTLQYEESGYSFQVETDSGAKKAPIVTTLESLRRDVLTYASQLGLTPAGLRKLNEASMFYTSHLQRNFVLFLHCHQSDMELQPILPLLGQA